MTNKSVGTLYDVILQMPWSLRQKRQKRHTPLAKMHFFLSNSQLFFLINNTFVQQMTIRTIYFTVYKT